MKYIVYTLILVGVPRIALGFGTGAMMKGSENFTVFLVLLLIIFPILSFIKRLYIGFNQGKTRDMSFLISTSMFLLIPIVTLIISSKEYSEIVNTFSKCIDDEIRYYTKVEENLKYCDDKNLELIKDYVLSKESSSLWLAKKEGVKKLSESESTCIGNLSYYFDDTESQNSFIKEVSVCHRYYGADIRNNIFWQTTGGYGVKDEESIVDSEKLSKLRERIMLGEIKKMGDLVFGINETIIKNK